MKLAAALLLLAAIAITCLTSCTTTEGPGFGLQYNPSTGELTGSVTYHPKFKTVQPTK